MSAFAQSNPSLPNQRYRSFGAKFFLLLLLIVLMSCSGFFIESLTMDRAEARGVLAAQWDHPTELPKTVLGVRLADSYRSMRRSLHYITLFLGLVFLTYFLFEVLTGKSVHPAQYALAGIAQTIFYLLLLSLAEHIGLTSAISSPARAPLRCSRSTRTGCFVVESSRSDLWQPSPACTSSSTFCCAWKTMRC
jgi:inner membrane protein involved in colicin E2 resistance